MCVCVCVCVCVCGVGMSYLLEQLTSEYPAIQQLALQALVSCMHDVECRERLREADGLTRLVSFLGNKV